MYVPTLLATIIACLVLTTQALKIRDDKHKDLLFARRYRATSRHRRWGFTRSHAMWGPKSIWGPGFSSQKILATSYVASQYGGPLGGACGWNMGINGKENIPVVIRGAAQDTDFFGEGLACGTCVKVTPIDGEAKQRKSAGLIVTVVNSCPDTCHSLDVEDGVVIANFGTRLGQWNAQAEVVPCGFLKQGIHIQYRQISTTVWDARFGLRFQDGAFSKVEVRRSNGYRWIEMKQGETNQFVPLQGGGEISREILDTSIDPPVISGGKRGKGTRYTIDFRFTSFTGEAIFAWNLPQPMNEPDYWFDTKVNFRG